MEKKKINKLKFNKHRIIDLNSTAMSKIKGGDLTQEPICGITKTMANPEYVCGPILCQPQ